MLLIQIIVASSLTLKLNIGPGLEQIYLALSQDFSHHDLASPQ